MRNRQKETEPFPWLEGARGLGRRIRGRLGGRVSASALDARNPSLVLIWAFGLFTLMHGHQYIGALLASLADRVSFDSIMSGKHETPRTLLIRGSLALIVGLPLVWLCSTLLWKRSTAWMGLGPQWGGLFLGIGLGAAAPILVALVLWRMKLARISLARTGRGICRSSLPCWDSQRLPCFPVSPRRSPSEA